jgi:hypothetical protein
MISTAVYYILANDATVASKVSNRIYPNKAVQSSAMPYIIYSVVSKVPTDSKDNGTGFDRNRVQIDIVDDSYTNNELLASYVRTALDGKKGVYGGTTILQSIYDNEVDVNANFTEDSEQIYHKAVDFIIITK